MKSTVDSSTCPRCTGRGFSDFTELCELCRIGVRSECEERRECVRDQLDEFLRTIRDFRSYVEYTEDYRDSAQVRKARSDFVEALDSAAAEVRTAREAYAK